MNSVISYNGKNLFFSFNKRYQSLFPGSKYAGQVWSDQYSAVMFSDGCYYKGSNHMNCALKKMCYACGPSFELVRWPSGFAPGAVVWLLLSNPQLFCEPLTSSSSTSLPGLISSFVFSPDIFNKTCLVSSKKKKKGYTWFQLHAFEV